MRLNVKDSMLIVLLIVIAVLVVVLIFTATTYMDGSKLIGKETNNIKGINIKFSIRDMNEEERVLELDQNEVQNFVKILQSSKFKRTGKKIDGGGCSITVTMTDGRVEKFALVEDGEYILYKNNYYKSYSAIGYFVSDLFKTE